MTGHTHQGYVQPFCRNRALKSQSRISVEAIKTSTVGLLIRTAIVEYDSAEEASGSSATRAAEIDTTAKYYDSMYRFKTFSLENQRLKAETCDGEIVLDLEVSDDCLWQSRYIMVLCMKVHMMSCTAFGKIYIDFFWISLLEGFPKCEKFIGIEAVKTYIEKLYIQEYL